MLLRDNGDARRAYRDLLADVEFKTPRRWDDLRVGGFDGLLLGGGHRARGMREYIDSPVLQMFVAAFFASGKPVAAVCHAPGVLRHVKAADGTPLVQGRHVTGFANSEERAAGLTDVVPFLVEDMLKAHGGQYSQAADWQVHVVVDGGLITGQNPASSGPAALALLQRLG